MLRKRYRFAQEKKASGKKQVATPGFESEARALVRSMYGLTRPPKSATKTIVGQSCTSVSRRRDQPRLNTRPQQKTLQADDRIERDYVARLRTLLRDSNRLTRHQPRLPVRDPNSGQWIAPPLLREDSETNDSKQPEARGLLVRPRAVKRELAGKHRLAVDQAEENDSTAPRSNELGVVTHTQAAESTGEDHGRRRRALPHSEPPAERASEDLTARLRKIVVLVTGTCSVIAENPEKEVVKLRALLRLLQELGRLHRSAHRSPPLKSWSSNAIYLSVRALTELFTEICPGYPIRASTEPNEPVRLSKAVLRVRAFEAALMAAYTDFVRFLCRQVKGHRGHEETENIRHCDSVWQACLRSCQDLVLQLSHFNMAEELIDVLVSQFGASEEADTQLIATVTELIGELESSSGTSLKAAVRLIRSLCRRLRDEGIQTPVAVLRSLLKIPFEALHAEVGKKKRRSSVTEEKKHARLTRRKRGRMQHETLRRWMAEKQQLHRDVDERLIRDMRDMQAEASPEELQWARRHVMTAVLQAYLRCLLQADEYFNGDGTVFLRSEREHAAHSAEISRGTIPSIAVSASRMEEILPLITEGLGQIALYVNAHCLNDLLATMYRVIAATSGKATECLTPLARLRCIRWCYQILIAQQIAMQNADPTTLDAILFQTMCPADSAFRTNTKVGSAWHRELRTVLELGLLGSRRTLPKRRGAAFCMRLLECALRADKASDALSLVQIAMALTDRYPALRAWVTTTTTDDMSDETEQETPTLFVGLVPTGVGCASASEWSASADPEIVGAMLLADQAVAMDEQGRRIGFRELCSALCTRHSDPKLRQAIQQWCRPLACV
jgi:hypothetical protein